MWQISYPPANGASQGNYFLPKSHKLFLKKKAYIIVSYRIAKSNKRNNNGSVMCRYLMAIDLIYDRMNTLYNIGRI